MNAQEECWIDLAATGSGDELDVVEIDQLTKSPSPGGRGGGRGGKGRGRGRGKGRGRAGRGKKAAAPSSAAVEGAEPQEVRVWSVVAEELYKPPEPKWEGLVSSHGSRSTVLSVEQLRELATPEVAPLELVYGVLRSLQDLARQRCVDLESANGPAAIEAVLHTTSQPHPQLQHDLLHGQPALVHSVAPMATAHVTQFATLAPAPATGPAPPATGASGTQGALSAPAAATQLQPCTPSGASFVLVFFLIARA